MSKTFESAVTITGSRNLLVSTDIGMDAGFFLEVRDKHEEPQAICFENRTAPALALAILEAAGVEARHHSAYENGTPEAMERIAQALTDEVGITEAVTAEAKEQAELEAEALELANSAVLVVGNPPYPSIGHMSDTSLRKWLAVARKAREMRAEK